MQIREYRPSDYVNVRLNLEEGGIFDSTWDSELSLREEIKRNKDSILVAEVDGKVVGNIFYNNWWGHGGFIFHGAVRERYRGQGIGTQLLSEAENRLRQKGVKEAALFIEEGNTRVRKYLTKRDYKDFPGSYKCLVKKL